MVSCDGLTTVAALAASVVDRLPSLVLPPTTDWVSEAAFVCCLDFLGVFGLGTSQTAGDGETSRCRFLSSEDD